MFQGSGFGAASTTTPFGQTSFGKPATSTFAPPVFGSPGTSLFGQTTQPQASSLFGNANPAPAFGQPQATTQPSFGGFTATGGTTSLFGNQQNATTGSTSLFGSTGTSAFGQAKPTFGGFGAQTPATGLFGQQSQAQPTNTQSTSLFGQTAAPASTSLFGASAGAFGATAAGGGTTFKFSPVTGTDTMVKNGVTQTISTRHHCITCMKEYESKSLEELRLEDYGANRKGPQQGVQAGAGLFGAAPQPSLFGAGTSTNQMTTTAPGGIFGGFNTSGNVFGTSGGGLFGKTGTTTATGFGTTTNTTNTFGFNTNNTTTNNPFGANTAQVKPFGAAAPQPSGSLFGGMSQPSNVFGSQNTTGFGSFGTQPNQAMGGGLFNQNKPSFQLGATPTTGFSFGQPAGTATNTAGTQSLFGAKPAGTGFGSTTFGAPATNAGSTFGSLSFGQNNQSSLFGSSFNKPATTGFSFGQNQTPTSTLGTGLNLGGNTLFGSTANKPGGLFGSNTTGGGLFGSSTFGNTGGGLTFGGSTNTGLGGTSLNLGGTSLLGNPAPTNQASNNPLNQQIMALASLPYGDSPLFKNLLPITGKTDELLKPTCPAAQKALLSGQNFKVSTRTGAKIKVRPIGQSNLTKKSLFDGLEEDEIGSNWQTKPSPKRLVLKPKQTSTINSRHLQDSTNNDEEEPRSIIQLNSPRYMHSSLQDICGTQQSNDPKESDKDHSSTSQKKLSAIGMSSPNNSLKDPPDNPSGCSRLFTSPVLSTSGQKSQDTSGPENTTDELSHYFFNNSENKENVERASSTTPDREESICPEEENLPPHPTGIRLHRVGYYTIPHLDELPALMDSEGRCVVENFTIGRLNYGNVFYPDSFDVSGLNLDEIVHIRHKEVVIYPDDSKKPPVGEGLNRRAQVTLDRVWPLDRATRDPISDPERLASLDYEAKLRNVSAKNKTRFVEYRPQTGSWVFKVDHFSKYGLSDSDEEDTPVPSDVKKLKLTAAGPPFGPQSKETRHGLDSAPPQHKLVTNGHMHQKAMVLGEDDQEMSDTGDLGDGPLKSLFDTHEELDMSQKSPSAQLANDLGAPSHKVQLMKHSFYHEDDDYNYNADFMEMKNFRGDTVLDVDVDEYDRSMMQEKTKLGHSFPLFRTQFRSSLYDHAPPSPVSPTAVHGLPTTPTGKSLLSVKPVAASRSPTITGLPPPVIVPQSLVLKHIVKAVPWGKSTAGKMRARCLADLALNMGHRFRVGWGPSCSLITLTTEQLSMAAPSSSNLLDIGDLLMHRPDDDFSPFITQRLQLKGGQPEDMTVDFQETIEDHLGIALNYSIVGAEDGCPVFAPAAGNFALHEHCKIHHSDPGFESVWELCLALWGDLPDSIDAEEDSHQRTMDRKKAVSEWLETHVNDSVKEDLTRGPLDSPEAVFALLTGHQVYEACRHAQDNDNHYESLLLSQVGTGAAVRTLAEKQLLQWVETQADKLIDRNKLKLSMLVAGIPLLQATESTINICENLDWKRAFALHLWYVCSSSASVTDALLKYDDAFNGDDSYAASPIPSYSVEWETSSGRSVFDVCYHLLCLFSFRSHPLESLLNPATHTSDPLDYRMSWLLMQVVESLGYSHLSELSASVIHTSFAAQLEAHGLWHWATFVLLHIKDKPRRQSAVIDMIGRHATLNKNNSLSQEELFLLERLNIPKQWLFQAKATLALSLSRYEDAAVFLLEAEEWNKAHEVIIQHIAAKAIINEKNEYIETLLKELAGEDRERSRIISGWAHQGALLWDYLIIIREIGSVIENRNPYALEKLQPQLGSLCSRIALLPTFTPMHRLCQTEIAKRTAHLVYSLIVLQRREGDEDSVCRLAKLVTQLPLPEDYSHPEMHKLVSSYLDMCLT